MRAQFFEALFYHSGQILPGFHWRPAIQPWRSASFFPAILQFSGEDPQKFCPLRLGVLITSFDSFLFANVPSLPIFFKICCLLFQDNKLAGQIFIFWRVAPSHADNSFQFFR